MVKSTDPLGSPASQDSYEVISISSEADDSASEVHELENVLPICDTSYGPNKSRKRKRLERGLHIGRPCSMINLSPGQESRSSKLKPYLLHHRKTSDSSCLALAHYDDPPSQDSSKSCSESGVKEEENSTLPKIDHSKHLEQRIAHGESCSATDKNNSHEFESWDPYDDTIEIACLRRRPRKEVQLENTATVQRLLLDAEYLAQRRKPSGANLPVRPWLPKNLRRLLPYKFGKGRTLQPGQMIHVEFTYEERFRLKAIYDGNKSANIQPEEMAAWLAIQFPGRQPEDVAAFIRENSLSTEHGRSTFSKSLNDFHIMNAGTAIVVPSQSSSTKAIRTLEHNLCTRAFQPKPLSMQTLGNPYPGLLKPYKTFLGTSGDVNAIEFSPDGGLVVVGCAATDDEYNRSGNLSLIDTGLHNHLPPSSLILDGKNCHRNKFSTISASKFVQHGRFVIVGGADETLKLYSAKGRFLHDMSKKNRFCTHDIATSVRFTNIAVTCHDSGDLDLHRFGIDGRAETHAIEKNSVLAPAVAVFDDVHQRLIAGYESRHNQPCSGEATIYDLETKTKLETIAGCESYAHMIINDTGQWVAGTNSPISGTVTVYDPREKVSRHAHKFFTTQRDINEISMMNDYITSSATDGTCHVWDVRGRPVPLHILKHGIPKQVSGTDDICGITGSAFFSPTSFITGSSDGCVKLWNLNLAQPFLRNMIEVDSPVTRLALSPEKDQLVIGENRGAVQLWSIHGDGTTSPMIEDRSLVQAG